MKKLLYAFVLFLTMFGVQVERAPQVRHVTTEQTAKAASVADYVEQVAAALPKVSIGAPAKAQEVNPDAGINTPGSWMTHGATPVPTISGGAAHFTGAGYMTILAIDAPLVKFKHKYLVTTTVANWSAGSLEVGLTNLMMGTATGTTVNAVDVNGGTPIASNFDTSQGITTADVDQAPGPKHNNGSDDELSAYRFYSSLAHTNGDDPIVYGGCQRGASHPHTYFGNTQADACSTFTSLRTKGSSTSLDVNTPQAPLNRSGYWVASMKDGNGRIVDPTGVNTYYKGFWPGSDSCIPNGGSVRMCVKTPIGLRFIYGFNTTTFAGGPGINTIAWVGGLYSAADMNTAIDSALAVGSHVLMLGATTYECWDGVHLDTPNHRDHMSDVVANHCPATHPYRIPQISVQIYYYIDTQAAAHKWRLTSDEMVPGFAAGTFKPGASAHIDYWEAWDRGTYDTWYQNCIIDNVSCGGGDMGNGFRVKDGGVLSQSKGRDVANISSWTQANGAKLQLYHPMQQFGYTPPYRSNGTFTTVVTAGGDGRIELISSDGGVFDVTNVSVVEVPQGAHGGMAANDNAPSPANDNLPQVAAIDFDLAKIVPGP
jgi:hypothetical protein